MKVYIVRYFDCEYECGHTEGVFASYTDALAHIFDRYEDSACIDHTELDGGRATIPIDGGAHGKRLEIEETELQGEEPTKARKEGEPC